MSFQIGGVTPAPDAIDADDADTTNGGGGSKTVTYTPTRGRQLARGRCGYDFVAATATTGDDITISDFASTCA
ncbi:hypothetical protein [Allobranchiibius sp. GilTou38]|uniref:hypothetical protein n=1 Tax=Allobranchiibius sp. GilTou38 TaxID=2815210 RepID=UPI001AA16958|nr:hypothetical protein [Allobranchiibius sp. GilTou38]MBO1766713.1 hypothetical protein [Allobranchiibius sp. GilTou38]